ncbi:MAG: hypothetical protein GC193_05240 [Cryomorphaceae bacterium]|nr:hypothetical protein [Cryomorphaceae bacterium]
MTGAVLAGYEVVGSSVLFTLTIDLSASGVVSIGFDDVNGVPLTFSTSYAQVVPINFNSLNPIVAIDCGQLEGSISFPQLVGLQYSLGWFPNLGTFNSLNVTINDLPAGNFTVVVFDLACGASQVLPIIIPDGQLSYTIDQVTPITLCTSQTVQASGMTEGTVQLSITGGSGFYDYNFDNAGGAQILPSVGVYTGIDLAGTYEFDGVDLVTGCTILDAPYTIPEIAIDLDIVVNELQPMIDNGAIVLQTATLEAEMTFSNNGLYSLVYEWSPSGFLDDGNGMYSEIDVEETYTVNVDINGGICQASTTYDVISTLCVLEADVNLDGIVNTLDFLAIAGAYGSFCNNVDPCPADINNDGVVNIADVLIFIQMNGLSWFDVCGND